MLLGTTLIGTTLIGTRLIEAVGIKECKKKDICIVFEGNREGGDTHTHTGRQTDRERERELSG